ncbi:hypothetical protein IC582_018428 [Cucumis melo]
MTGALAWQVNYVNEKKVFWVLRRDRTGIARDSFSLVCAVSSLSLLSLCIILCVAARSCLHPQGLLARSFLPNTCPFLLNFLISNEFVGKGKNSKTTALVSRIIY